MKKKIFIVSGLIVGILLLTLVILYAVDMNRMKNNRAVVFSTWGYDYCPPEPNILIEPDYENSQNESEHFFFGKVIESNRTSIIVEPNEDEEVRKSADKIAIGLGEHNDAIYVVGTNVKITYDGTIMETYPAQVKAIKIELKSVDEFSLVFYQKTNIRPNQKEVIISKGEVDNINYNVYAFEGHVAINLNSDNSELTENSIPLREALLQGKITMNEIIEKANKDLDEEKITGDMFKDGGTMIYKYDSYTIIKYHTMDGNRDVYIGTTDMNYNVEKYIEEN